MKYILLMFPILFIGACTQLGAGVANMPTYFDNVTRFADISYGQKPMQKLDVYVPQNFEGEQLPVLMFIHGGNWQMGNKDLYKFLGSRFARNGYIVVIPDYTKYSNVKFPTFAEEGAMAVNWVYQNIETYNGDRNTFFISGHSAGAHTAAILSTDERYLKDAGLPDDYITAFAGLAGPYDFTPEEEDLKDIFGPPENYKNMQVPNFVEGNEPPILLLHGAKDEAVWLSNLEKLVQAYEDKNLPFNYRIYEDVDHVEIITTLTWVYDGIAPVEQDMLDFFVQYR